MTKRKAIHKEIDALHEEGAKLSVAFQKKKETQFQYDYQRWYTKALKVVSLLAPDRYAEFRSYYEIDPKRKCLGSETYAIQDYIKGADPRSFVFMEFDERTRVFQCFYNQLTMLRAVGDLVDSVLANIEGELYAEIQDGEISVARQLQKVSQRAAGALVGVIVEGHLQKVAKAHGITIAKKNPTIADLNEQLKSVQPSTHLRGEEFASWLIFGIFARTKRI